MSYIYRAFGFMFNIIYGFIENYGIAVILLTVLIKIILLPLTLKQQKSMTKMQRVQPKLAEIMEKYKDDKQKQSEETMKLYKEYGVNPMGGCLPILIQFPILIAFYRVIQQPAQYVLGYSADKISSLCEKFGIANDASAQINVAKMLGELNFNFLGLDLAAKPWDEIKLLLSGKGEWIALTALIIPVLAGFTTYLTSKITTLMNDKKEDKKKDEPPKRVLSPDAKQNGANSTEGMTKSMTTFMPFMTLFLSFTFPAALGLYWAVSNAISILQNVALNKYYNRVLQAEIAQKEKEKEEKLKEKMKRYNLKKKKRG